MTGSDTGVLALNIIGLSHAFGKTKALRDVDLKIEPGSFRALLGLNGAGKTTLFSLITRLYNSASGTIKVFFYDVRRQPTQALQQLGVVFQNRTVDAELSIIQNMTYHCALHGIPKRLAGQHIALELERIGIWPKEPNSQCAV